MNELAVAQQTINTLLYGGMGYAVYDFVTSDRPQNFIENLKLLKHLNPWQKQQYPQRLETFKQAQQMLEQQGKTLNDLTDAEQGSPASWLNQGFSSYMNEVIEGKVELLRNALVNGLYGDFPLELRTELFRMANIVQPLDVQVLAHLVTACGNVIEYQKLHQEKSGKEKDKQEEARQTDTYCKTTLATVPFDERAEKTPTLDSFFPTCSLLELQVSLDRLREAKLICNPRLMRFGLQTPYMECTPTTIAQTFLDFIADPSSDIFSKKSEV